MSQFVDECQLCAQGGDGGAGAVSFRREAHVARGGPDGGDGGAGGDVWLVADRNVASLLGLRDHPHRRAEAGTHGKGQRSHGRSGGDIEVRVPEGTTVTDLDGEPQADLVAHGDRWRAARGGEGGRGNASFLSNRLRAPRFAEQGEPGEERWYALELKLLADVALVGLPNVGKSTLISRISAAHPRIADYPFTTLEPHLGVVRSDDVEFVVADIPGLIEGASEGRGLGDRFLRHVERARVLAVLADLAPLDEQPPGAQVETLLGELGRYRPELLDRPRIVVGSKADLVAGPADDAPDEPGPPGAGVDVVISAVTGAGVDELVGRLGALVEQARSDGVADRAVGSSFAVHRPVGTGLRVSRADDGSFVVEGRAARRAVALSDLGDPDALLLAQDRLHKLGLDAALRDAGVVEGDTVHIGDVSFDFAPETAELGGGR